MRKILTALLSIGIAVSFVPVHAQSRYSNADITVTEQTSYYINEISPLRIPDSGSMTLNLGSTLEDIYNAIDSHTVTLRLKDGEGNSVTSRNVSFTITENDNTGYDPLTVGEQTVMAHLVLPDDIQNLDNKQPIIYVNLVKRTVKSATIVRLTDIPYGTLFDELGLPENAPVQFTDGTTGLLPVTWDSSTYNPDNAGAQVVRGTFNTPLPVYAENPDNRQPVASVTVAEETPPPSDRIEFSHLGDTVSARLVFGVSTPPNEADITLYAAYKEKGILKRIEKLDIADMTASFTVPKAFENCDIMLYVWDKALKPLMSAQYFIE